MKLTIIAAMTQEKVIGKDNSLPWNIPQEMEEFRKTTQGNVVIMGRKTFESLEKPLENRENIVVSKTLEVQPDIIVCKNPDQALQEAKKTDKEIFVIGGAEMYKEFLPYASKLRISYIKQEVQGDTYFPEFSEEAWDQTKIMETTEFTIVEYTR